MQVLALEKEVGDDAEHYQGDDFLDDFQLHEREWSAVFGKSDAVGGHHEAVLYAGYEPGEEYHAPERPVGRDARLVELEVAVPRQCHEDVAAEKQQNRI